MVLAEVYDLDKKAGQLFCSSHTTLGMLAVMNKILRLLEAEMKMDELVQGFMVASLDVQLVEPFYANTISSTSTHSSLKKFFISLYESNGRQSGERLLHLCHPVFRGVDWELFEGVKASYKEEVLCVVSRVANEHEEEVLKPGEGMLPYLRTVLARQRRDCGIDEERFPSLYPVES